MYSETSMSRTVNDDNILFQYSLQLNIEQQRCKKFLKELIVSLLSCIYKLPAFNILTYCVIPVRSDP